MTTFTYRDGIAVLQLVAFFPCLVLSLLLCFRQGLKAVAACWRFLIILAALRVAGSICQLLLIHDPQNIHIITAKLICDLLGIAPLTLAAVGLLQRVDGTVEKVPANAFRIISLISLVGLALGIYGATQVIDSATSPGSDGVGKVSDMLVAALAMFVACLGLMLCLLVFLTSFLSLMPRAEKVIMYSIYACAPFLIVRMVYACLGDFGHLQDFSIFGDGNDTIYLIMSVLMEIIVMVICLVIGFKCPPTPVEPAKSKPRFDAKKGNSVLTF
ncbi:hypothetical protein VHEMI09641 [[Torrubiella] hemipterigena]|uniref:DUF7702 domain-containing protein n=1 Tax=[Torrubiella] hemipterigena TaxID=1531966 RepID=A0A0A1TRV8_9HYPO|nr:hypothetical protein VHEMI09641 [[Torrubiella] hemipterigena]